jgi:hypothetical protein
LICLEVRGSVFLPRVRHAVDGCLFRRCISRLYDFDETTVNQFIQGTGKSALSETYSLAWL